MLVTGAAGFIGSHVTEALLARGDRVTGLDNLDDYYDPKQKLANLSALAAAPGDFDFIEGDVRDEALIDEVTSIEGIDGIAHLAAMAGVRASIENPRLYFDVNLNGTMNILEALKGRSSGKRMVPLVLGSTSSVYGRSSVSPFKETESCDRSLAPYPASKRAAEVLCFTYHHLYGQSCTILRFFSVYGPRMRPDMMPFKLAESVRTGVEVPLYNGGKMHRDWTFVSDIVDGVVSAIDTQLGFEVVNLARGEPVLLADFVDLMAEIMGRPPRVFPAETPASETPYTCADISKAKELLGYEPKVSLNEGVSRFVAWYNEQPSSN